MHERRAAPRRAAASAATDADRHRSTIFDRRNVEFLLWEQPAFAAQAGDRETLSAMLDAAEALVTEHASADAVADAHEPTWDPETNIVSIPDETRAFLDAQREGGFTLLGADVEDGGLGLSLTGLHGGQLDHFVRLYLWLGRLLCVDALRREFDQSPRDHRTEGGVCATIGRGPIWGHDGPVRGAERI